MADFQDKGIYLGHSGFLLELESATLIFDWYQGEIPPLRGDKPVYIFASNINQDHFRPEIFGAVEQLPHAEIFIGYDHSISEVDTFLDSLPEKIKELLKNESLLSKIALNGRKRALSSMTWDKRAEELLELL